MTAKNRESTKAHAWFRRTYSLNEMYSTKKPDPPVVVKLPDDQEIVFWLRSFPSVDIRPQLCCSAMAKRSLNNEVHSHFQKYSNRILPIDSSSQVTLPYTICSEAEIDKDGNIPGNWIPSLDIFPKNFQDIHREMSSKTYELVRSYVKVLRWIQRADGKQSPFGYISFEWSFDKVNWQKMPGDYRVSVKNSTGINLGALNQVTELWNRKDFEPLGHELMREAFDVASSNPRSGLMIGYSALETGLKNFIDFLLPQSNILLEKMPSPPALTMIRDVIPTLQKELNKPEITLPSEDLALLRKWNEIRNKVTHGIPQDIKTDGLEDFLLFVQNLLYLLDEAKGHEWAAPFAKGESSRKEKIELP